MKFKKILAGAMAGAMVLGSVVSVSAATETLTGTAWWTGSQTGNDVSLTTYGELTFTINADALVDSYGAFNVEVYDASGNYFTTGSDVNAWFAGDALTDSTVSGADVTGSVLTEGETYTVTVDREDSTFTVVYYDGDMNAFATLVGVAGSAFDETVNVHVIAQVGTYTVSATDTTSITASSDTMSVLVEESKSLPTITTSPSAMKSVLTYSSSDETVATVSSDGVVTGVTAGTAVITASYAGYSTTVEVKVTEDAVALEGVTVSDTEVSVVEGASATVTATPNPTDTTDAYSTTWASADESIATVEDGVITGVAAGETTVTVTYTTGAGSFSAEVAVTVTEATVVSSETTSEDDSSTDETSEAATEEETEETVTTVEESATMTIDGFWTSFTSGYEVTEDGLTITLTTTSNTTTTTNNWENVIWVLYSSDSGYICTSGADSDAAAADNYVEYYVGRADAYGWDGASAVGTATLEATYSDDFAWETWLAATQAGAEVTITAVLDGDGNAVVTLECEDMSYTVTIPVNADSTIYLALTGENCTLSDLTVNGESANFPILVEAAVEAETEETETEETTETPSESEGTGSTTTTKTTQTVSGTSTGGANTGDASPIIPIAVALLGCAVVVVASKKRMA